MVLNILITIFIVFILWYIPPIVRFNNNRRKSKISFREAINLTGLPIVTFYNGCKKINLLLDTGSTLSYINSINVQEYEHQYLDNIQSTIGFEGVLKESSSCIINIQYGENKYLTEFAVMDLQNAFNFLKREYGVTLHGILGSNFFKEHKYVLDFTNLIAYTHNEKYNIFKF